MEADVKNTGLRAADEVAEIYLIPPRTEVSPSLRVVAARLLVGLNPLTTAII